MNDIKIKQLIENAAQLLNLDEKQTNYLDMLVNLAYNQGQLDRAQEERAKLEKEYKSFQEEWEEVRMK